MTDQAAFLTEFPEINALLEAVLSGAREVLGEGLVGMVVHGSLASGGFDPQRSDIDFQSSPARSCRRDRGRAEADARGHHGGRHAWADHIEGSYIPLTRCAVTTGPLVHPPCAWTAA
jgi:hypothetical protein